MHRRGFRFIGKVDGSQQSGVSSQYSGIRNKEETRGWRVETRPTFPQVSSFRSPASTIVGRESDLAFLHERLAKALNGERQIVFVTGEVAGHWSQLNE